MLAGQPDRWPQAVALLLALARLAEERGAVLSLRFRETFARLAARHAPALLPDLRRRGHEVGAHAHGRRLAEAVEALRAAGAPPRVAAPGLVQAGPGGRRPLLQQAAALGITTVTDHGPARAWAYEGLLPRAEEGVVVLAPTVRPFDWGLMSPDGARHGLLPAQVEALRAREAAAARHGARWFGFTFHDHDLCPPGSLTPRPASLDALAGYLGPRFVPSAATATIATATADGASSPPPQPGEGAPRPPTDGQVRMARAVHAVTSRLSAAAPRLPRRPPPPRGAIRLPVQGGQRHIVAERLGPAAPRAVLVLSHAGPEGGRRLRLRPFGPVEADLLAGGWAIWLYDRAGTGDSPLPAGTPTRPDPLAPGNPAHTADWKAVLARARQEQAPVVALTWSAGLIPPLRAARAGHRPDALIDAEGPADRWSLLPPGDRSNPLSALDPWSDEEWEGREAVALVAHLQRPYARLQAEQDHVHGPVDEHARRLRAAAAAAGCPVGPSPRLPGRLHAHPQALLAAAAWALQAAQR